MIGTGDTSVHRYTLADSEKKSKNPTPDRVGFLFLQSFWNTGRESGFLDKPGMTGTYTRLVLEVVISSSR